MNAEERRKERRRLEREGKEVPENLKSLTLETVRQAERFGTVQDKDISIETTGAEIDYCFKVRLADYEVLMHGGSLVDLIHKANIALLDWQKGAALRLLADIKSLEKTN